MTVQKAEDAGFSMEGADRATLANRLREAREYLKLSQDEVARIVGIPRSAMSLIENGQRKVDALELKRLAKFYGRPVSHFTGDEAGVASELSAEVAHLARSASALSQRDREELARFAEFLRTRSEDGR